MNHIYKSIGMALLLTAMACSTDNALEYPFLENSDGNSTDGSIAQNPYWGWVSEFPGFVPASLPRINAEVILQSQQAAVVPTNFQPLGWQSCGYYVAPGEIITITTPTEANGLKYRIGGFSDVLENDVTLKRYADMNVEGNLVTGENQVVSYFGGHLYFFWENGGTATTLQVTGVIKSPDFILGVTNPTNWKEEIANTAMTYGELRSDKITLTLPIGVLKTVSDPAALVNFYDDMLAKDYDGFYDIDPQTTSWRLRTDIQLSGNSLNSNYTGGYPAVVLRGLDSVVVFMPELKNAGLLKICRSFAHTYQEQNLGGENFSDALLNLPYHRMFHRNNIWPSANTEFENATNNFMQNNDPAKRFNDLTSAQKVGMFIQLAQQYGWNIYPYIARQVRTVNTPVADQDKNDALAMFATEYANQNLLPFFEAWGFVLSSYATDYMKQFPEITVPFWNSASQKLGNFDTRTATTYDRGVRPAHNVTDRSQWVVTAKRIINGEEEDNTHPETPGGGNASDITDGDNSTFWHSKWENENGQYPHIIDIDMSTSTRFNYIYYQQRNTTGDQNKCRRFQLFIKDNDGTWIAIENHKVFTIGKETTEQRIYFNSTYESSQLRIYLLSPHPQAGKAYSDVTSQLLSVSIAEFGIGMLE